MTIISITTIKITTANAITTTILPVAAAAKIPAHLLNVGEQRRHGDRWQHQASQWHKHGRCPLRRHKGVALGGGRHRADNIGGLSLLYRAQQGQDSSTAAQ
jgi:hypothetical protein